MLSRSFARAGAMLALVGVAAGMGVLAVAFLCAALFLALLEPLGAALAALVTGAVLVAVAAVLLLAVRLSVLGPHRPPQAAAPRDGLSAAAELGEMLGEEAGLWTRRHPGAAMLAALMAGFVVGSSPNIRARLLRLL